VVEPGELDALAPSKTKTIEIEDFVELSQIDPILFDHPYYLAPGPGGAKPYRVLLEAMKDTGKVAIARVVIRSKEQLVAIRAVGAVLVMETMLFADEVRVPDRLEEMSDSTEVKTTKRELDVAKQLVDSLANDFDPDRYRDTYREQVLGLIERKAQGEEITAQAPKATPQTSAPDLMSALQASLDEVRKHGKAGTGKKPRTSAKPKTSTPRAKNTSR
jgi:DNA end-binding protein Ku